jgi:hypothetical protein
MGGEPRLYLLSNPEGQHCLVKPDKPHNSKRSGLRYLTTQELLHDSLHDNPQYGAARVFGHASLSAITNAGYSFAEYVSAPTLHALEHSSILPETRPAAAPPVGGYQRLADKAFLILKKTLDTPGLQIDPFVGDLHENSWDLNHSNILCVANDEGEARLIFVDQAVSLLGYDDPEAR